LTQWHLGIIVYNCLVIFELFQEKFQCHDKIKRGDDALKWCVLKRIFRFDAVNPNNSWSKENE
jgi:hypothetical protein